MADRGFCPYRCFPGSNAKCVVSSPKGAYEERTKRGRYTSSSHFIDGFTTHFASEPFPVPLILEGLYTTSVRGRPAFFHGQQAPEEGSEAQCQASEGARHHLLILTVSTVKCKASHRGGLIDEKPRKVFFAYPPETVYSFRGDMQKSPMRGSRGATSITGGNPPLCTSRYTNYSRLVVSFRVARRR